MRLIFSRKGFDSAYGGNASPILPDGTLVSIPIPEHGSGTRYADVQTPAGSMYDLMRSLGITRYRENKKWNPLSPAAEAHLDPDLVIDARPRARGWLPVFGQCDAAQGHLNTDGVRPGDLFLFFGTFRETRQRNGALHFSGKPIHVIFGYMQVGRIVRVNSSTAISWCGEHPHLVNRNRSNNTLYIAADSLSGTSLPGAGTLPFSSQRVLSDVPGVVSQWRLPGFFHPEECGRYLSRHPTLEPWRRDGDFTLLQTKSPGQEYVIETTPEMAEWAHNIVTAA